MLHTATQWRGGDEWLKIIVLLRRSKGKKGEKGGWIASFIHVVWRLYKTCWWKKFECTEEEPCRYKRCFWEMTLNVREPFIPLMSNEVDLHEPNKIKRIIFKTTKWGWFCFIWMAPRCAQSCKELRQTGQRYSTAEREQKTTRQREREERGEPPPLSFYIPLVNMSTWSHICYTAHPPTPTSPYTYTHTDVRAHKSTVGCILGLPSPTSQPPLFNRAALTDFHIKRRLH